MVSIGIRGVSKVFGSGPPALSGVDLVVGDGEFLALAGPSGSGKTTLLRMVSGLDAPTAGTVWFDGTDVTSLAPQERNVAMVFQDHGLYAHKTALGNITFPLEVKGVTPESERERRAVAEARHFRIEHLLDRKPGQLAAGHRQAVATARSVVREADVLLMDEPLAHMDAKARVEARVGLHRLHRDLGATILYVTNDQSEAMALGDRVAVFDEGALQQIGSPQQVHDHPVDTMVAGFFGTPPMSLVPGELGHTDAGVEVLVGTDRILLGGDPVAGVPGWREWLGRPIAVGLRPQHLTEPRPGTPFERCLHGVVSHVEDHGSDLYAEIEAGIPEVSVTARLRPGSQCCVGDRIELEVAVAMIRCFDPGTGRAI